jgi:hypothetical protein
VYCAYTLLSRQVNSGPQLGAAGGVINYANDLDVSSEDHAIYFTSSTAGTVALHPDGFYDTMRSFILNMCTGDHTGRLLRYTPEASSGTPPPHSAPVWYATTRCGTVPI